MMKPVFVLAAAALLIVAALSLAEVAPATPAGAPVSAAQPPAEPQAPAAPALGTELERISYSIGVSGVRGMRKEGLDVAPAAFLRGITDELSRAKLLMTEQQMSDALVQAGKIKVARQQTLAAAAAETLKRGQAFLAENAKKEGVVTLPSGLQYRVIAAGSGPSPAHNDTVTVHYRGTLLDGTEFDSSYQRARPAEFKVGEVIRGWQEGLKLMKKGAKWQLFVPSNLAYGEQGNPPAIGPNEALIFDVELIDFTRGYRLNPQN